MRALALGLDLQVARATSVAYDLSVGGCRYEVKFSTEDPPRFQQVRDPRRDDGGFAYDGLVCISGRPDGLVYWLIPAGDVANLMDAGKIIVQHAQSTTKWFLPSGRERDVFAAYRHDVASFSDALAEGAGL